MATKCAINGRQWGAYDGRRHPGNWTYDCQRAEPAQYLMTIADTYGAFVIVIGAPRLGAVSAGGTLFHTSVSSRLARQNRYALLLIPATVSAAAWPDKST